MHMKKVLITTVVDTNYGNRLQNYALQEGLKKLNYAVCTVNTKVLSKFHNEKNFFKAFLYKILPDSKTKFWAWDYFDYKYIDYLFCSYDELNKVNQIIETVVVGSDQIWNPIFYYFDPYYAFADFFDKKKISYAASIGLDELPKENEEMFEQHLRKFSSISIRESAGAKIVNNLSIDLHAEVVLDPTMLITKEEWQLLAKRSRYKIKDKYIFKYILGFRSAEYEVLIESYAKENNLKIVDITKLMDKVGPIEFIWLIEHAERIFTDSFHGSVFSILFQKQFWVFERPAQDDTGCMNSRIDTLLLTFDIQHRCINNANQLTNLSFRDDIDFQKVEAILGLRRKESYTFLKKALSE